MKLNENVESSAVSPSFEENVNYERWLYNSQMMISYPQRRPTINILKER